MCVSGVDYGWGAYASYPQMAYSLRSPLVMIRLAPVCCCDASYSSCRMIRGWNQGCDWWECECGGEKEGGTYDGDDVAMFILASVTLLFPLHDCGCERRIVL